MLNSMHGKNSTYLNSMHGSGNFHQLRLVCSSRGVTNIKGQRRNENEAFCGCFSEDGNWLVVGNSSGAIEVYRTEDWNLAFTLKTGRLPTLPCMTTCFRPSSNLYSTDNVLLSGDAGGQVHHWHATSGKHLSTISEANNEVYCVDYEQNGQQFATAGLDSKVRVYDGVTRKNFQVLSEGNGTTSAGHTNRVFALKWVPSDACVILSGGWDSTIQTWDLRMGQSVRSIYGPLLCGNALDMNVGANKILTGSWRMQDQLQEWDYGSGRLIRNVAWQREGINDKICQVYCGQYGNGMCQNLMVAGGSGANEACFFNSETGQFLGGLRNLDKAVVSVAFSNGGSNCLIVTINNLYIISMKDLMRKFRIH